MTRVSSALRVDLATPSRTMILSRFHWISSHRNTSSWPYNRTSSDVRKKHRPDKIRNDNICSSLVLDHSNRLMNWAGVYTFRLALGVSYFGSDSIGLMATMR